MWAMSSAAGMVGESPDATVRPSFRTVIVSPTRATSSSRWEM